MGRCTYSSEFKLQVVLEALQSDGTDAEAARAYDVHPVTLSVWKTKLKENGSKAFGGSDELTEKKDKIANLERMLGRRAGGIRPRLSALSPWSGPRVRPDRDRGRHPHTTDAVVNVKRFGPLRSRVGLKTGIRPLEWEDPRRQFNQLLPNKPYNPLSYTGLRVFGLRWA